MVRGVISAGTGMGVGAAWRCCHGVLKYLCRDKTLHRRQVRILRDLRHCPTGGPTSPQLQGVKKDVFDLTRTLDDDFWPWASMEGFKDGMLSSPKYDSKMNVFNPCKVIVFSNQKADRTELSADRYDFWEIPHLTPGI